MKARYILLLFLISITILSCKKDATILPKVIICTDININNGDPDDRQSMAHLLMYANEVEIVSIIPERWNAGGLEASMMAIDAYEKDFNNPDFNFQKLDYPTPESIRALVQKNRDSALESIISQARTSTDPIHILIWGNMKLLAEALNKAPDIADNIRIYTIATHRMYQNPDAEKNSKDPTQFGKRINWNGPGRNQIYYDKRFSNLWWLENDWGYNGMFSGQETREFLVEVKEFGELGFHIWEVVQSHNWAHYFRAGDTPTLLYLLEPEVDIDDPTTSNWAGKFIKPYPQSRPNYWIDDAGNTSWNYENPENTWTLAKQVYDFRVNNLLKVRENMYTAYRKKMKELYTH